MGGSPFSGFTGPEGLTIRIDRVVTFAAGVLSAAWGLNFAEAIGALFDAFIIDPLRGLATFGGQLVSTIFDGPILTIRLSWAELEAFIASLPGPVAFAAAVAATVTIAYLVYRASDLRG